jgi:signal transduction histidine kinase/CheY-like chemotaxis protein
VAEGRLMPELGQRREVLEGQAVAEALGDVVEERFREALDGQTGKYERDYRGHLLLEQYVPLRDEAGHVVGAMGLWFDMTERKRVEEHLRSAQKLESIGLLAGGIAHDFNNLLVGVIGNAGLAETMLPHGSPVVDVLKRIVTAGEQAAHLTSQMLAYAGKGRFIVKPVDLSGMVLETGRLLQASLSGKIEIRHELAPGLPAVETDPSQMRQVYMNLALNAAEAIGDNPGLITVETGEMTLDAASVAGLENWSITPGPYVYLEVSDTGSGMDESTLSRIFDPFFTTKFQGRGLGLAAVSGIVRAHRGAIRVTSRPGFGSTFRVILPSAPARVPAPPPAAPITDLRGEGTVLVVDDESLVREVARRSLERQGYEVLLAANGPEAVEIVRDQGDRIRLVVLDLSMPGMSGEDTLPRLREIRPDLEVMVSSGYSRAEALRSFQGVHISGFVQKPFSIAGLAREVRSVLVHSGD